MLIFVLFFKDSSLFPEFLPGLFLKECPVVCDHNTDTNTLTPSDGHFYPFPLLSDLGMYLRLLLVRDLPTR